MRLKNIWQLTVLVLLSLLSSSAQSSAPTITSVSPASGPVGSSVTITGTNFGASQAASTVTFNGVTANTITAWSSTSIVATVPTEATTGAVVVTVDGVASNSVDFSVSAPIFTLTGSLATARMFQSAISLDSGAVLVIGGVDGFDYDPIPSAELYNPAAGTFSTTGSLNTGRIFNTATLLTNGQVLVTGGSDINWNQITSAELYNPAAGTFTYTGNLNTARTAHSATLLNNGQVLIAGGWNSNGDEITSDTASSELYSPATGSFVPSGNLNTARDTHTATLLNNGKVLIVGGFNSNSDVVLASAELYDPASGSFTVTGSLNFARMVHTATLLNNGLVLITGGYDNNGNAVGTAELYDPATGTFTETGSLNTPRYDGAQGTLLNNGMVLIAGGQDNNGNTLASAELYDPASGSFTLTASMNSTRQSLTTTLLNNGQVLVAAGMDYYADVLNSAELYEPATQAPPGLVSVAVGPANSVISVGTAQLLSAVGTFSDDSTQTLGSLTWTSSDSTIAAISNDASNHGNALGVAPGLVTMNACAGSVCGSTTITVVSPPSITGISPTSGFIGTTLTITGTNFGTNQGTSTVTFNGTVAAEILNWGATSIVAMVPAGATTGSVAVSANAASSTGPTFTISSAGSFGITSIFPSSGVPGMQVQINGGGFGTSQGSSTISLNGTNAVVTNWTDANIVAIVPSGATSGPFSVTVGGQTVHSSPFTVTSLPSGWLDADVGAVGVAGSSSYTTGTFSVSGAGSQISGSVDAFHFVYQTLSGDGSIVARVRIPSGTQAGVMVRQSLDAGSPFGTTLAYGTHVEFDARAVEDGSTSQPGEVFNLSSPFWVELVRSGSTLTSYRSSDGVNWTVVGSATLNMTPNVYVGLVVDSGSTSSTATATFDNVSVNSTVMPAPVITSVSATTGSVGSQVVISGSNFGASQGSSVVTLNAMPVTINSWSDSSISITIPAGATSGLLVVSAAPSMNDSNPVVFTVTAQPLPSGWLDVDVGAVGVAGSSSYTTGTFSVSGAGSQISGSVDAFHFVYQTLSGDGSIVARVRIPSGTQAGVMVRQSLDAGSPFGTTLAYGIYVRVRRASGRGWEHVAAR